MAETKTAPARRRSTPRKLLDQSFEHPTPDTPTHPFQTAAVDEAFAILAAELHQVEESVPQTEPEPPMEPEPEEKSSNPYPHNPFFKVKIGRFEIWRNRNGYAVWTVEPDPYYFRCHARGIETLKQARETARHLDDIEQADNAAYLAKLRLPA